MVLGAGLGVRPLGALGAQEERLVYSGGQKQQPEEVRTPCKLLSRPGWSSTMREQMKTRFVTVSTELASGFSQTVLEVFLLRQAESPLEQ